MRKDQIASSRERGPKIGKLTSIARMGEEVGRVYRGMRRGEIDPQTGTALVKALLAKKTFTEAVTFEQRLDAIEEHIKGEPDLCANWLRVVK